MTKKHIEDVKVRCAGIPCLARVTTYKVVPPWKGSALTAPSDMDYHGYTEVEFDLLDRRGRPAPWLEAKLTSKETEKIEEQIIEYFSQQSEEVRRYGE